MFSNVYAAIMNPEINPLRSLPRPVRFQLMTMLSVMWSIVFCTWSGLLLYVGPSIGAHMVLLVGIFLTAETFRRAGRGDLVDHRAKFRDSRDGCARYDDMWGA